MSIDAVSLLGTDWLCGAVWPLSYRHVLWERVDHMAAAVVLHHRWRRQRRQGM